MKTGSKILLFALLSFGVFELFTGRVRVENQTAVAESRSEDSEYLPKNLFVDLAKKINPAIVNISTTQVMPGRTMGGRGPRDPFQDFLEDFMFGGPDQRPRARKFSSLGSGFIIESDGLILTNNHVIQNATDIQVQLTEGAEETYKAEIIGQDSRADSALIKISVKQKLTAVELGDSDKVQVGEWVAAFGNPFGHGHSMTKGIISAKERELDDPNLSFPFLQTDASINPGNSGGPLVSADGKVIGVNTAIDARAQGIGFAIPINIVKRLLPDLKSKGKVTRGYLGVGINALTPEMIEQMGLKTKKGAIVLNVQQGSPADEAGLEIYDVVTEFAGKPVNSAKDLSNLVADTAIGVKTELKIIRNNKPMTLQVRIAERPDENVVAKKGAAPQLKRKGVEASMKIGMTLGDLTPELAKQLDLKNAPQPSVVVVGVEPNSIAAAAGIQLGDIILDINKKRVTSADRANTLFTKGNNLLRLLRDDNTFLVFLEVK